MKQYTVAILGATGAVGQEMMNILEERNFPVGKLIPLASARSAGKTLMFKGLAPTTNYLHVHYYLPPLLMNGAYAMEKKQKFMLLV